jgi:hypothetical protein
MDGLTPRQPDTWRGVFYLYYNILFSVFSSVNWASFVKIDLENLQHFSSRSQ